MNIQSDYNLLALNTFRLNSISRYFFELNSEADLPALRDWAREKNVPVRFLGGGSNLILPERIDALVVKNNLRGVSVIRETLSSAFISSASGEDWHSFVMNQTQAGHFGLENLALIPGTVGGAPIQNIGAYGVEVNRFITKVTGFDFETGTIKSFTNADCKFEYRDSIFKSLQYKNCFVTRVDFELLKTVKPVISYAELAQSFAGQTVSGMDVVNKVIEVRQKKLPDVLAIPNAGSFFKNPIVSVEQMQNLKKSLPDLISYAQPAGDYKLAAGQLIDKLGYKGKQLGSVSMYRNQALVMVNMGQGQLSDVKALAKKIIDDCWNQYGIRLETEPIFW